MSYRDLMREQQEIYSCYREAEHLLTSKSEAPRRKFFKLGHVLTSSAMTLGPLAFCYMTGALPIFGIAPAFAGIMGCFLRNFDPHNPDELCPEDLRYYFDEKYRAIDVEFALAAARQGDNKSHLSLHSFGAGLVNGLKKNGIMNIVQTTGLPVLWVGAVVLGIAAYVADSTINLYQELKNGRFGLTKHKSYSDEPSDSDALFPWAMTIREQDCALRTVAKKVHQKRFPKSLAFSI